LKQSDIKVTDALHKAYMKTDEQVVAKQIQKSGSTAVTALIYEKDDTKV